ncbi:hypothetical protein B0H14DRAFT_2575164 [Mycena olivaceomarginata]|nr:hypothetical protein B0H14DRAFT_2575164 [Mycena olivaceomarginata]
MPRIASLTPHPNQDILSPCHQSQNPATEQVYSPKFDYNFAVIPASNGPIYMRADVTDMPDCWDTFVESPERKRWLNERGLEKCRLEQRWWGSFKNWLSILEDAQSGGGYLGVPEFPPVGRMDHLPQGSCVPRYGSDISVLRKSSEDFELPTGPPSFPASIDVSLTGQASLNSHYGFYLQATVVPPSAADAKAHGQFTLKGESVGRIILLVRLQYTKRTIAPQTYPSGLAEWLAPLSGV